MTMKVVASLLSVGMLLAACGGSGSGDALASRVVERPTPSNGPMSPSPYPWTDRDALHPGDPLDFSKTQCDYEVTEFFTIDCVNGIYVHLSRPEVGDLEGIDGVTPWRAAEPIDPKRGSTTWAFENCMEHDT